MLQCNWAYIIAFPHQSCLLHAAWFLEMLMPFTTITYYLPSKNLCVPLTRFEHYLSFNDIYFYDPDWFEFYELHDLYQSWVQVTMYLNTLLASQLPILDSPVMHWPKKLTCTWFPKEFCLYLTCIEDVTWLDFQV